MFLLKIVLCILILQIIEIKCDLKSVFPQTSTLKNVGKFNSLQLNESKGVSLLSDEEKGLKRSARFLGKLAFVIGTGNEVSEINDSSSFSNFSNTNKNSPYLAAFYEPFLFNLQSFFPFNWFFSSTTTEKSMGEDFTNEVNELNAVTNMSSVINTALMNNKINQIKDKESQGNNKDKQEETKKDVEMLSKEVTEALQGMKNNNLFFNQDRNTSEKIETENVEEKPKPAVHHAQPTGPTHNHPVVTATTVENPKPTVHLTTSASTTDPPTTAPSVVPSATTVTENPLLTPAPNTLTPITRPPSTVTPVNPTNILNATETMINNGTGINNGTNVTTEFPGYYGGYPQNVNQLELTTDINYSNDYNDIRGRLSNDKNMLQNEYEFYDNNFDTYDRTQDNFNDNAIQYYGPSSKIIVEDGFKPNINPDKLWYFNYRANQFA